MFTQAALGVAGKVAPEIFKAAGNYVADKVSNSRSGMNSSDARNRVQDLIESGQLHADEVKAYQGQQQEQSYRNADRTAQQSMQDSNATNRENQRALEEQKNFMAPLENAAANLNTQRGMAVQAQVDAQNMAAKRLDLLSNARRDNANAIAQLASAGSGLFR